MVTYPDHYRLGLISVEDLLYFLDHLFEGLTQQELWQCLAGKNARLFAMHAHTTIRLLSDGSKKETEAVNTETTEIETTRTRDVNSFIKIVHLLPEDLNLIFFKDLVETYLVDGEANSFEELLLLLLRYHTDRTRDFEKKDFDALKEILDKGISLVDVADALKRDPDQFENFLEQGFPLDRDSSLADLVDTLALT